MIVTVKYVLRNMIIYNNFGVYIVYITLSFKYESKLVLFVYPVNIGYNYTVEQLLK